MDTRRKTAGENMETQKDPPEEAAGKNKGESPSDVQPPAEVTIVPGYEQRQQTTDEACLKEAEAAGEESSSEVNPPPGDPEETDEDEEGEGDYYCPGCGRTGDCTCGNPEPYRGHPWVFDEPAGLS